MNQKVSVIVPVYKVEQYLDECIESIVNQTYSNLEIILIDDGSPDRCPQICDEWEKKDSRIRVIHKTNGGLSDARNTGLAVATGDYIVFVDSDDKINLHYVTLMYQAISDNGAEIAACDLQEFFHDDEIYNDFKETAKIWLYNSEEALRDLISGKGVRAVAWNKMYKSSILEGECFEINRYHEDEFFTYKVIDKANIITYVDKQLYYYRQRPGSIMSTVSIKHIDLLDAFLERLTLLKEKYPTLYQIDKVKFCISCAMHYRATLKIHDEISKQMLKEIQKRRNMIRFSFKEVWLCSLYEKKYIIGTRISIGMFCRMLNYIRKDSDE